MRNIIFITVVILSEILLSGGAAGQDNVVINEVMSSNTRWNYDSDFGAYSDWIEIYNPTGSGIDLEGWYLTDDPENADKWEIPGNTVIPANGYLLFWADDRDLVPGQTTLVEFSEVHEITVEEYHLNFRINRDREVLQLIDPGLEVVDEISLRDQERDFTFGRQPGNPDQILFLGEPTPMGENSSYYSQTFIRSGEPVFSLPGGMYDESIDVALEPPSPGTTVRYTTDGSEPGSFSPVYTGPLPVNFSQVIKARAYEEGKLPGEVVTCSYILGEDTSLPLLSISTEHKNLWGFDFGLYQNNYKNREIFAHMEYFDEAGNRAFNINAGLQLFGSQIFLFDQKPFSVFFRNRYGQDSLYYRIFSNKSTDVFHSLVLRNGGNDNPFTMFRDGLGAALIETRADIDHQAYRPVVVYMNGEYWGIFNIREKLNEAYLATNHGINPDHVDIIEDSLSVNNGDANHYEEILDYVGDHDLQNPDHFAWVTGRIDLNSYINYMTYKIWSGYQQWQVNNKFYRERLPGASWRWIAFDMEHALGGPGGETFDSNTFINALDPGNETTSWYTLLFRKLMDNDYFRAQVLQRMALFMDTFLSREQVLHVIDSLEAKIAQEMPDHILRWESPVSMAAWQQHVLMLKDFAKYRNSWMYEHIMQYFSISDTTEVTISQTEGGRVLICSSNVLTGSSDSFTFFRGLPVEVHAYPDPGYRFSGWGNGVDDRELQLHIEGDTLLTARFEKEASFLLPDTVRNMLVIDDASKPWVAGGNVVIPKGDTLIIGPGVKVLMPPGASLVNKGVFFVEGAAENPVVFNVFPQPEGYSGSYASIPGKQRWGGIIASQADTMQLRHLLLQNASSGMDYGNYKAAINATGTGLMLGNVEVRDVRHPVYVYQSNVLIDSCRFSSSGTGDLIHLKACHDAVIRQCDLKGNFYEDTDAIDLDNVYGALVENNMIYSFFGSNSDGIDMGEHSTGIVIRGNTIKSISDKGISVGQGSEIIAEQNIIVDCNQGFGIKDFDSFAFINQNTLYANRTGIAVFEKNTGNGGGAAQVENTIISGSIDATVFVDDLSALTVSYSLSDMDSLQGYNNLLEEPLFAAAGMLDFYLSEGSPCINSGTPDQQDPDGTRADIGAFLAASQPAGHRIMISELNYNAHREFNTGDWVELFNGGDAGVDLSGWVLKGQEYGDEFVFGHNAYLPSGEYLVAARRSDSMQLYYPELPLLSGNMSFGLSSEGELIRLYDDAYRLIHSLQFGTTHPWPDGPNGKGATLERFSGNLTGNPANGNVPGSPGGWHSSYVPGGTPGKENSTFGELTGIYINELMAKNDFAYPDESGQYDDWLEVYNSNPYAEDLGGLYFIYGEEQRMTMIPYFSDTTVLEAGGYGVFWADKDPEQGVMHLDFNLPAGGGDVGIGQVTEEGLVFFDRLAYGSLGADEAYGRFPDGAAFFTLLNLTPGNSNLLLGSSIPDQAGKGWRMYPNPAYDFVMIAYPGIHDDKTALIYTISGQAVKSVRLVPGGLMEIDISDLEPGIYLVRLNGTGRTGKLVVH